MLARIFDNHHIYLEQITQGSEESIIDWFSVREPNAFFVKSELWDGWHRKYNTVKQRLALPFLNELQTCCDVKGIPLQISDERPAPKYPAPQPEQITETFLDGVTLEEYQVRILRAICSEEIGIISATTGSGKTEIMCGIVKMFRCPTVIITEQIVVLEQIVQRLQLRNVVHNNDIGMFCYGNMPNGNIVIVGSIQSLSTPTVPKKDKVGVNRKKLLKKVHEWADLQDECLLTVFPRVLAEALYANPSGAYQIQGKYYLLLRDYYVEMEYERQLAAYKTRITNCRKIQDMVKKSDLMLVDECDLATSDQYGMMFRYYFNGRRRYGFSGTPFDSKKQVNNIKLKENLGNIIGEADRNEVQSAGRIVPVRCYFIGVGVGGDRTDSRAFDIALKEEIEENSEFHELVANIPRAFPNDGTLILVDTSVALGVILESMIPDSKFIFGSTSKPKRRKVIGQFESRELKCLIGSKILKRGLDLKGGCENLVIIGGGAKWSEFDQKIGRAVRLNERGWSRVFSFFFFNNKYLYKHSKENLKAAIDMGYPTKVIVNDRELDGAGFVRSQFRIPK